MQRKGGVKRYKSETDPNVKDRLMLNILIKFDECSTSAAAPLPWQIPVVWRQVVPPLREKWHTRAEEPPQIRQAGTGFKGKNDVDKKGDEDHWLADGGSTWLHARENRILYCLSNVRKMTRRWGYSQKVPVKR